MFDVKKLAAIQVGLASPETIRSWSKGEVTKPETINYRSQKPEMQGLYCEKIFGPSKDYECHCGRYKKIRFAGVVCEKCGVEVTVKEVRRERMGHIELHSPCTHIWYLKGIPSRIATLLDISPKQLEEVVYYAAHIVLSKGKSSKLSDRLVINEKNGREIFKPVINEILEDASFGIIEGSDDFHRAHALLNRLSNPTEVFDFQSVASFVSKMTGAEFSEGASAIQILLDADHLDLDKEAEILRQKIATDTTQAKIKYTKRLEVVEAFRNSTNKPEWMVLNVIPVIPPDLRPMLALDGGRYATSDLNDLYRRVISRNNRLKKMIDMNAPQVILMNEKRMLQEAVDALIDNGRRSKPVQGTSNRPLKSLSSALKGKQGRFRQNLLGKRVDYSARSVIAVGPTLKMYECGLPREMAVQLLRPFIASKLLKRGLANAHKQADKIIDRYEDCVLDIVEEIIGQHPVLLNRAPTLHRLGIQAFRPKLVDGRAIRLHPLVCTGFNADFDGDQMAVHVPLSKAAQEEALHLMLASNNILGPKDGKPIVTPSQDMVLGNYYLTLETTKAEFEKKAEAARNSGDLEAAELYEIYALSEGKVFRSVDDVLLAYQTKQIHLHNRIAILGSALLKTNFTEEMNNSYLLTTVGKIIFNLIFPSDFPYLNQVSENKNNLNETLPEYFVKKGTDIRALFLERPTLAPFKKKDLSLIINEIFQKYDRFGKPKTSAVLDKMKDQGFKYATVAGFTVSIADIEVLGGKSDILKDGDEKVEMITQMYNDGLLTDSERHDHICKVWASATEVVKNNLKKDILLKPRNPIFMMSDSGARGNISNITQLIGMRGLMANTSGGTIELPVKSCFREGLTVSEFFIATHGARKGGADTALKTADSGYLTRRLVDVSQDVIVREIDCGTDHGFEVSEIVNTARDQVIVPLYDRLLGRYTLEEIVHPETGEVIVGENVLMDETLAAAVVKAGVKTVKIRSLFGCETKDGVCVHCYGRNLATGKEVKIGEAVGIMAAQSIGEPGTQLTMRTFHTGGVANAADITQGLPRVAELFEARKPKGVATVAEVAGKVVVKEVQSAGKDGGKYYEVFVKNPEGDGHYIIPFGVVLKVKNGDQVEAGTVLTEGSIYPKDFLRTRGVRDVQEYILSEILATYSSQGVKINTKHVEIIIRQMLRNVKIEEVGDTNLLAGDIVDVFKYEEENERVMAEGGVPATAKRLVQGITKAALSCESFLSAASFQETSKVLTDASMKGKVDRLRGLGENLMIGKLIPAGTGHRMFTNAEPIDPNETKEEETTVDESVAKYFEDAEIL